MDRIKYKEGILICGGNRESEQLENAVFVLSVASGKDIKETCDLINQFLQSFEDTLANVADALRELAEAFTKVLKDICESCRSRRTRHGSSRKAEKPRQAIANIKWSEKYRPP